MRWSRQRALGHVLANLYQALSDAEQAKEEDVKLELRNRVHQGFERAGYKVRGTLQDPEIVLSKAVGGLDMLWIAEIVIDRRAERTGELHICTQMHSVDKGVTPGWFRNSVCQVIVFFLPTPGKAFTVSLLELREFVLYGQPQLAAFDWITNTEGVSGRGLLLPIARGREFLKSWKEGFTMDGRDQ